MATEKTSTDEGHQKIKIFKAALINIFKLTMAEMTTCDVIVFARSDQPTENDYPTLQFVSAPRAHWGLLAYCFGITSHNYCFGSVSCLSLE